MPHVIIAGSPPIRLTLEQSPAGIQGRIETAQTDNNNASVVKKVAQKLTPLIPFVDLHPVIQEQSQIGVAIRKDDTRSLLNASTRLLPGHGRQYYYAGNDIMPGLGSSGEVLVAVTLCDHLLRACKKQEL